MLTAAIAPFRKFLRRLWARWMGAQPGFRRVIVVAAVFWAIAMTFALHRYLTLYASYDQGIFNQVFWNNAHGRWFESSLSSSLSSAVKQDGQAAEVFYRRLGQHFTPALLLWLPIYALHSQAITLVFIQVSLIAIAGLILYALARQHLTPIASAWISTAYYCANAVIGPTFSNFHDLCQVPLYAFTLLLAMEKRCWWLFWLMAGFWLLVREDQGFGLFSIGVYMVLSKRFPRPGIALCAVSFLYVLLCTSVFMPFFSPDISKRFMVERFGQYVDGTEASSIDVALAMLSQPWLVAWEVIQPPLGTLRYLVGQWLPFGFIPAFSPAAWAMTAFPLLKIFLQQGNSAKSINIRYAIEVVPGLAYGAILWWKTHSGRYDVRRIKKLWAGCLALSLLFSVTSSPHRVFYFAIPDSFEPWVFVSLPAQWSHVGHVRSLMNQIPPDASVSATTYLVPPLSSRRAIIRLPWTEVTNDSGETQPVDYLFSDTWRLRRYQSAFKKERGELQGTVAIFDQKLTDQSYGIVALEDGVALLQRGVPSNPDYLQGWLDLRQELLPLINPEG
ncbi:MAG: DUF2079 domain-containing protein [Cyanophyceae cyanobacterium]